MSGIKYDGDKPRWSLLPAGVVPAVVRVLTFGSRKYADDNWQIVENGRKRYYDAMQRHIEAWWSGEQKDIETGEHHLAHAVCCAFFLMWMDRPVAEEKHTETGEVWFKHNLSLELSMAGAEVEYIGLIYIPHECGWIVQLKYRIDAGRLQYFGQRIPSLTGDNAKFIVNQVRHSRPRV